MINPFQNIKEQQAAKKQQEAEEQCMREERLRELETAKNEKKGFHIPHPVQAVKDNKEIKSLKRTVIL